MSHAVREIRNRLPDVFASATKSRRVEYVESLDTIAEMWSRADLSTEVPLPDPTLPTDGDRTESTPVAIPRMLFGRIAELIAAHTASREKPFDAARRLFEAVAPENQRVAAHLRPVVDHWLSTTQWFVKRVHDNGRVDTEADELAKRFEQFEATLQSLTREYYRGEEALDEILLDANR